MDLKERFLKHINKNKDGHWYWIGGLDKDGYGKASDLNYNSIRAHRLSYSLYKDDFNPNLQVLHKCDIPNCCNPEHLYQGNQSLNINDCVARNRHHKANMTHCKNGHEYTPENTYMAKQSNGKLYRRCLICTFGKVSSLK